MMVSRSPRQLLAARPHPLRFLALATLLLAVLVACGKEEEKVAAGIPGNDLLAYVPVGSPYLAANLEPTPNQTVDGFLAQWDPLLTTLQTGLVSIRTRLESEPEALDGGQRLGLSFLQELDGKLNRQGLESLGFDLQAFQVVYAMGGAFPVARMSLGDPGVFRSTVQRILDRAGVQAPEQEFQGRTFWRLGAEQLADHHGNISAGLYIAIVQDHLAISVFPDAAEAELLPLFLGLQMPPESDAAERLAALQAKYGYTPYFTAVADLQLLADEFLDPESLLSRSLGDKYISEVSALGDVCRAEISGIISHAPRLVMGTTQLQPEAVGIQYVLETQASIAEQLLTLPADVPSADMQSKRLLDFSFGMNIGPLRDFLREKAQAVTQEPYQCEKLEMLNGQAAYGLEQLEQPMPPFVNNFRGVRLTLNALGMGPSVPQSAEGLLAVHVEKPEMFVGMAQMFLPDLSNLELVKGDPPVPLPASLIPIPDIVAFAALGETAIGISVGAGEEAGLLPYLDRKAENDGTFFSMNYDTATYMDFIHSLQDDWPGPEENPDYDTDTNRQLELDASAREILDAMRQSWKTITDRSQVSIGFTGDGVVIDSRQTFKEPGKR